METTLNKLITENQAEINKLLISYNIPILDETNMPITSRRCPSGHDRAAICSRTCGDGRSPRGAAAAEVPEPDSYRLEDYRAPTPATLRGAKVDRNGRSGTDLAQPMRLLCRCAAEAAAAAKPAGGNAVA